MAQRWLNSARRCIDVRRVPIVRPYTEIYCENIEVSAFEEQEPCYLDPFPSGESICDLDITEWAKIFWTIRSRFCNSTIPSLKNLLDVKPNCPGDALEDILKPEDDVETD